MVIKPDSLLTAEDQGMPFHKRNFANGHLYVHFTVKFPDTLEPAQVKSFETALSQQGKIPSGVEPEADTVTVTLLKFDES